MQQANNKDAFDKSNITGGVEFASNPEGVLFDPVKLKAVWEKYQPVFAVNPDIISLLVSDDIGLTALQVAENDADADKILHQEDDGTEYIAFDMDDSEACWKYLGLRIHRNSRTLHEVYYPKHVDGEMELGATIPEDVSC